jgi:hypothetical protein
LRALGRAFLFAVHLRRRRSQPDAAEKGGYQYRWWKVNDLEQNEGYNGLQLRALSEHFHDPDFWKALATAHKWEDVSAWRFHWHRFIDHIVDRKDAESFFAAL